GAGEGFQPADRLLAGAREREAFLDALEGREFLDVRAGNEAAFLSRAHDDAARQVAREPGEHLVQLLQNRLRKNVRRASGLVESQPRNAVGIARQGPGFVIHERTEKSQTNGRWSE